MIYTFVGIAPFVEQAAVKLGLVCLEQIHRSKSGWHLTTIVNALSQLPDMAAKAKAGHIDPKAPQEALDRVMLVRKALAVQLQGVDDAIAHVVEGLGLTLTADPAPATPAVDPPADPTPVDPAPVDPPADSPAPAVKTPRPPSNPPKKDAKS